METKRNEESDITSTRIPLIATYKCLLGWQHVMSEDNRNAYSTAVKKKNKIAEEEEQDR